MNGDKKMADATVGTGSPTWLLLIRFSTQNSLFSAIVPKLAVLGQIYLNSCLMHHLKPFSHSSHHFVHAAVSRVISLYSVYRTVFDSFHSCVIVEMAVFVL